ncbi:L-glutamate gamma-semialdehyde dehydrogenase [Rhodothermus marinus]|uniref:L-glutamate gamma-semialdehyde dehydrogenase n=1 Tax=Rhodothermus marinus (strain ATCC 43812 / DSM 4252 / R-10) TaxID=518766 RepID=D0MI13_RHOM4|nr:L-glutamate gamma-semialdehyde dehydrogenase [Rhodothermus marinus]ACY48121.1 delta-1-pyrroline-5-carboxylate dehydrogenase [Rhodothermus marinus DSM 4252]
MHNAIPFPPVPQNEPVRSYAPGTPERTSLRKRLQELKRETVEIKPIIGGREIATDRVETLHPPHELTHSLGTVHLGGPREAEMAIEAALKAREEWARTPWTERAAIFLKAAELLSGPWRDTLNAATMLGQSKNVHQAEIDAACELADFWRFNVYFMARIYQDQPLNAPGVWNRMEYRPLEGFVFAVTPFNFTSIQGNLPTAPALMGNTVVWKPATTAVYSAYFLYKLLEEAGLPPGVINMVPGHGPDVGDTVFASPHLAGLHFTGSTETFRRMWRTIGANIDRYRAYPRIVGETGGKDFIVAHVSADPEAVATAIVRGSFEYQGQKCSAASRVYLPDTLWPRIRESLLDQLREVKMGTVEDFTNFINAVIDKKAFDKIVGYIEEAKQNPNVKVLYGGNYSDREGYFIEPTVLEVTDPKHRTMCEEIFGPVVSIYVYPEARFEETLDLVNNTSPYALTGAIFAQDRKAIQLATERLVDAAGNFYINDKPTGAIVAQQPFGGARASGTNDKAGSQLNLLRWVSPRAIKETFVPPRHFKYPYLEPDVEVPADQATSVSS